MPRIKRILPEKVTESRRFNWPDITEEFPDIDIQEISYLAKGLEIPGNTIELNETERMYMVACCHPLCYGYTNAEIADLIGITDRRIYQIKKKPGWNQALKKYVDSLVGKLSNDVYQALTKLVRQGDVKTVHRLSEELGHFKILAKNGDNVVNIGIQIEQLAAERKKNMAQGLNAFGITVESNRLIEKESE